MNSQPQSNAPQAAHIVLDLETLSTDPHAAVASIGAVALTAEGTWVAEFHLAISTEDQHSRHVSPSTCEWWDEQSNEARAASILAPNPAAPTQALEEFTSWVLQIADPKKVKVWGNGSGFDNVILSSLFADYPELVRPWAYWNDRDMRTVLDLYPQAKDVGEFEGVKHNALHDARHEAKQLAAALRLAAGAATPPAHAQSDELEALRDMLDTARIDLDMLREALDVPVEPHQSLQERMLEAALLGFGAQREWLQPGDMEALQRFEETTSDDQSYDIGKEAVKRLAHFGCLESHGFGRYGITAFGSYVLGNWARARELPFKTQADRDAEHRAAIAASATQGAAA